MQVSVLPFICSLVVGLLQLTAGLNERSYPYDYNTDQKIQQIVREVQSKPVVVYMPEWCQFSEWVQDILKIISEDRYVQDTTFYNVVQYYKYSPEGESMRYALSNYTGQTTDPYIFLCEQPVYGGTDGLKTLLENEFVNGKNEKVNKFIDELKRSNCARNYNNPRWQQTDFQ